MTDQAKPISRSWRRFLRFSVRGLIVLVLVVGAGLGWIVREAHIQRDAVAAITTIGGEVNYDWEWCDGAPVPGAQPSAPRWLVDLLGVDYFGHATRVSYFRGSLDRLRARTAEVGARLSELRAKMNEAFGSAHYEPVTQEQRQKLSELTMGDVKAFAAKLKEVDQLSHREVRFTDEDVAHLKWLTRVERRVSQPDPLGNIIGRREAGIEHANEQRSTGSANVDAAQDFEPKVSLKPTSDATQTDSGQLDRCVSSDDI